VNNGKHHVKSPRFPPNMTGTGHRERGLARHQKPKRKIGFFILVEREMSEMQDVPPAVDPAIPLQSSIRIRQARRLFRRTVRAECHHSPAPFR
jgi:hypothetical protein